MGVAIIFIMASHTLGGFAAFGIIGVEWFLVLSAIGQYYSLAKNNNIRTYYRKRFKRLLPAYLIVAIPYFLIKFPFNFRDFIIRLSGLNLVLWGELYFWFISLIVICYLIAPFYFCLMNKWRLSIIIPFILVGFSFLISFHTPQTEILITRIPVFLLGMNFAKYVYDGVILSDQRTIVSSIIVSVLAVLFLLSIYIDTVGIELVRLIYFYCSIPSLFFVLLIIMRLPYFNGVLSFMGAITYELYLLHQHIVFAFCNTITSIKALSVLLSYGLAILLSFFLHKAVKSILKIRITSSITDCS